MAHFAKLDENNNVLEVLVVKNSMLLDSNGVEREELGIAFLVTWSGGHPYWKQTSYNNSFRKTYATIGSKYDPDKNIFIAPKPFNSWILDTEGNWQAPISKPLDNKEYYWNEAELNWQEVT